ncbi:putative quinol monooxygenase [Virgibacillus salexigens]|uniref:putative quinol monooxygenase n=1 Tax=Virgibacillus salexigens TaxID=61016 RepID=UPI00190CD181|nr:antibiotic biosynthesis monooxygenase [Virgibacillus salexigens]
MLSKFGLINKFTAVAGKREVLAEYFIDAASTMKELNECILYEVGLSEENTEDIYVYEVWINNKAHRTSLSMGATQKLIQNAKPYIHEIERITTFKPVGGKGI